MDSLDALLSKPKPVTRPQPAPSSVGRVSFSTPDILDQFASGPGPVGGRRSSTGPSQSISAIPSYGNSSIFQPAATQIAPSTSTVESRRRRDPEPQQFSQTPLPAATTSMSTSTETSPQPIGRRQWGSLASRQQQLANMVGSTDPGYQESSSTSQFASTGEYAKTVGFLPHDLEFAESSYVPTTSTDGERRVLMVECPDCGRTFKRSALEVHQKACKTVFAKKAEPAARTERLDLDNSAQSPTAAASEDRGENWRSSSQQLRQAMRNAKRQAQQQAEPDVRYL